jgi:hypothetical protein
MTVVGQKRKWPTLNGMSALPSEADIICETGHVRKVPNSDIGHLFDHLVGASEERLRYGQAKGLGNLGVVGAESRRVAKTSNPMEIKGRY